MVSKVIYLCIPLCIVLLFFSCEKKADAKKNEQITESVTVDTEINGIYELKTAYSFLYGDYVMKEIETEKLGSMVTINNGKGIFCNEEHEILNGNGYAQNGLLDYEYFLGMFAGRDYGNFDKNIIGEDYTGFVKTMIMQNKKNTYYIYFADNKLIIQIDADENESEFENIIYASRPDSFFYITEKISDDNNQSNLISTHSDFIIDKDGTITGYRGAGRDLIIPAEIDGKPVIAIGDRAFRNKGLTSVVIPPGVRSIGENAFWWNNLASVTIPDSVNSIGDGAFWGNELTTIAIPGSVVSIGKAAFLVNQLTEITIPNGITSISENAFRRNRLTSVTIPNSVTSIGRSAFAQNQLTSVNIPASVTFIGSRAFGNNQLASVSIPNDVNSIEDEAFHNNKMKTVTIPGNITNISSGLFRSNQLTSVTISEGVVSIGDSAFWGNQLTSVTLPSSLESIGKRAFYINQLTSLTIPDGLFSIDDYAFRRNQLTNVVLGNAVMNISETAFDEVSFLFQYLCNNKKAGTYKAGLEKKDNNFNYTETENGIYITLYTGSEKGRFVIPERLNGIEVKGIACQLDEYMESPSIFSTSSKYDVSEVIIPNGLVFIGSYSFAYCYFTRVSLPSSLHYIGRRAFNSGKLTRVTIPDDVSFIGDYAFYSNQLTTITIGTNVPLSSNSDSTIFDNDFDNFYRMNRMKAGTYTFRDGRWNIN
jgi:hypothetical protein